MARQRPKFPAPRGKYPAGASREFARKLLNRQRDFPPEFVQRAIFRRIPCRFPSSRELRIREQQQCSPWRQDATAGNFLPRLRPATPGFAGLKRGKKECSDSDVSLRGNAVTGRLLSFPHFSEYRD